ncbi:MAG: OmpH family outer membrane protein [Rikenellaceae bacterium]
MKKVFIAAAFAFAICSCANNEGTTTTAESVAAPSSTALTLAYVNMDRVLLESELFANEGVQLQKRTEAIQRDLSQKEQALQSEAQQLQQKYQKGLITSTNAQKEQQAIESRAQTFQASAQTQIKELDEESTVLSNRTQKLFREAVENVNAGGKYSMIVNSSALIDADTTLDISTVVLDEVNRLYRAESKK